MSVLDRIKELDAEKAKLLNQAKAEALQAAEKAVADLNELGFNYRLVQSGETVQREPGKRRTGIRDQVLAVIRQSDGMVRADILKAMEAETKQDEQSISNALAALKKAGIITAQNGVYTAP